MKRPGKPVQERLLGAFDKTLRIAFITVAMFLLLEFVLMAVNGGQKIDGRAYSDVYDGAGWAEGYFAEFRGSMAFEYSPYTVYRRKPGLSGTYINTDNESLRRTYFSCGGQSEESFTVFVFGGSTVWGTGARDNGTIPSALAGYMCGRGVPAVVVNYGESGYTSTQEVIRLWMELRNGRRPDAVVFYDGINDVFSAYQNGEAGLPQNVADRKADFNARNRLNFAEFLMSTNVVKALKVGGANAGSTDGETMEQAASVYMDNVRVVKALGREYGFEAFFYWQPIVSTKSVAVGSEKGAGMSASDNALKGIYPEVTAIVRGSGDVRDLTGIFDGYGKAVFMDLSHVSEEGNAIIAERMGDDLIGYYRGLPTAGGG